MKNDQRGKYGITRKEYVSGQPFYVFEHRSGDVVSPLTNGTFRIELKADTNMSDVRKFEEWLNHHIEAIAYTPNE